FKVTFKLQSSDEVTQPGIWSLELGIFLEFGAWNLGFPMAGAQILLRTTLLRRGKARVKRSRPRFRSEMLQGSTRFATDVLRQLRGSRANNNLPATARSGIG